MEHLRRRALAADAMTRRLTVGLLILNGCCLVHAQTPGGQQAQNQGTSNPQDQAVKLAGQSGNSEESGKPLDEQKSAALQVITRQYDLNKLTHEPKVPGTVFRGRVLWVQKCAFCHDGLGQPTYKTLGPWLDRDLLKTLTDDAIKAIVQYGTARMPGFQYGLSPSQLDDLLSFLKTVPASDKPTPGQLAGRSEGGNSD
jgi:mono/diheme cytochrome c family protein